MSILELDMLRRRAHKDRNHEAVVSELRALGASVLELHQLGDDKPDLIVGFLGITALVELKSDHDRSHHTVKAKRDRLERQVNYLAAWRGGPAFVASSTDAILGALRAISLNDQRVR